LTLFKEKYITCRTKSTKFVRVTKVLSNEKLCPTKFFSK